MSGKKKTSSPSLYDDQGKVDLEEFKRRFGCSPAEFVSKIPPAEPYARPSGLPRWPQAVKINFRVGKHGTDDMVQDINGLSETRRKERER